MTTPVTPTIETTQIVTFAAGVRAALADLPAEEVDDLTEGLEADLAEAYAEDLQRELPDPLAYATELRSAAGLPVREPKRGPFGGLAAGWADTRRDLLVTICRNPALASVLEFLAVLRPLWWVVRAWLATWLLAAFFGMERGYSVDGTWWIVLVAFVVISVQWGRGLWQANGVPGLIVVGNVVAAVALFPVLAAASDWGGSGNGAYDAGYSAGSDAVLDDPAVEGLSFDGHLLENIYAYDAKGRRLTNVQLFDVDGNPLDTNRNGDVTQMIPDPATLETGAEAYNVYPLALTKMIWDENGQLVPEPTPDVDKTRAFRDGPFLKVPAVQDAEKVAKVNR